MSEATAEHGGPRRARPQPLPGSWWVRRPSYFLYVVRELTVVFMTAWLVWFLYEVWILKQGAFQTLTGNYVVLVFSLVCLFFALWHAVTFLNLSGLILRLPVGDTFAPPIAIQGLAFGALVFVTAVGAAVMIYLGYVSL